MIVVGLILIAHQNSRISLPSLFLGFFVLTDALLKIQISLDSKVLGIKQWWMILSVAIFTGVIGFLLLLKPGYVSKSILMMLGIAFLADGILNLVTVLIAVKVLRNRSSILDEMEL